MTDLQLLALWSPVALVLFVSTIVLLEELGNQRAMKREKAAADVHARAETHRGHMTIETNRFVFENKFDASVKRRVG